MQLPFFNVPFKKKKLDNYLVYILSQSAIHNNYLFEPVIEKTNLGSDQVRHKLDSHKMVRGLKSCIKVEEGLYYPFSENKGADQLCSHCKADLRLCFCICRLLVFLWSSSFYYVYSFYSGSGSFLVPNSVVVSPREQRQLD